MKKLRVLTLALAITSCLSCSKQPAARTANKVEPLIFSAAASTKDVMEGLAAQFTSETGIEVRVNPGPSSGLANQILAGAPADLFLSANQQWALEVQKGGQTEASCRLLTNRLVIVAPADNPGQVQKPSDLLSDSVEKIALAGEKVPAGIYAEQALTKLGLFARLTESGKIVRGQDVRVTLSFVERGEVEAGIVYSTDVSVASRVVSVHEFDPSLHDEIVYVLVLLKHAAQNPAARKFYDFLQSPAAEESYKRFKFDRLH
ncbi:MAG: molybdate ABC transporter substrate-binding protein [Pirellulales bacterium]